MNPTLNKEEILSLQEQHREVDKQRSTKNLDIPKVKVEARALFQLRRNLSGQAFQEKAQEAYPGFIEKYPQFFEMIEKEDPTRINESLSVLETLLDKLKAVQDGHIDHEKLRDSFFEKDLASKYYKRK